jgi:ABC-type thiamine transport system ATPase subunit
MSEKPIFVIKVPFSSLIPNEREMIKKWVNTLKEEMKSDYYVIAISHGRKNIEFEIYNLRNDEDRITINYNEFCKKLEKENNIKLI